MKRFAADERAWADFFITRIGLILFAAVLLLSAFKVYPMFNEQQARAGMDAAASDIVSKIEAVDVVTVPGYKYVYAFDEKDKNKRIEISTEFVVARYNLSTAWGERELVHAEPVVARVYPPNSYWSNTSGLRKMMSDLCVGKNGDAVSPLNFSGDKGKVDEMFISIERELARTPFVPDMNRSMIIEKVMIYYNDGNKREARDHVIIYQ
ncbi:MAG: hypothetical protein KJ729_07615 [Euryarchaeota archaeon]|nr:hypothetical protein [Euryarchaeota archaeon]